MRPCFCMDGGAHPLIPELRLSAERDFPQVRRARHELYPLLSTLAVGEAAGAKEETKESTATGRLQPNLMLQQNAIRKAVAPALYPLVLAQNRVDPVPIANSVSSVSMRSRTLQCVGTLRRVVKFAASDVTATTPCGQFAHPLWYAVTCAIEHYPTPNLVILKGYSGSGVCRQYP